MISEVTILETQQNVDLRKNAMLNFYKLFAESLTTQSKQLCYW